MIVSITYVHRYKNDRLIEPVGHIVSVLVFRCLHVNFFVWCSSSVAGAIKSPSALFVASDGVSLRVYQAVLDARSLLTALASKQSQVLTYCAHQLNGHCSLVRKFSASKQLPEAFRYIFCCKLLAEKNIM